MGGLLRFLRGPSAASPDMAASLAPIAGRCVFIVGPARSGTTVLLNALNASRDIFMLGEPDFHADPGTADFAARYHAQHAAGGNLECKSTALPPLLAGDAPWYTWLAALAAHHKRVGAKIAINPGEDPDHTGLYAFQGRYFYDSSYIFCFRNPLKAAVSRQLLSQLNGGGLADWNAVFDNILATIRLYLRMVQLFPEVHAVVHEDVSPAMFTRLGGALQCNLSNAAGYYSESQEQPYTEMDLPEAMRERCRNVVRVYDLLRAAIAEGPALPQREQNVRNINAGHRTALGQLAILLHPEHGARVAARAG